MRVALLGCGYVGLELGRQLRSRDHDGIGVRRSNDGLAAVEAAGLEPVQADLTDPESVVDVPDADALVYLASPGQRGIDAARHTYVEGLRTVVDEFGSRASPPDRLLYASSTGVYGDHDGGRVDEQTPIEPETDREQVLADAERIASERAPERGIDGTIVRFAGLYGPDRYRLDRYLNGPVTEGILNLLHQADAAGAIRHLLTEELARGEIVLAVDDEPVEKAAFARWLAAECGTEPPEIVSVEERLGTLDPSDARARRLRSSKRCRNDRLRSLGYEFDYPTYREGYRPAIERGCSRDDG